MLSIRVVNVSNVDVASFAMWMVGSSGQMQVGWRQFGSNAGWITAAGAAGRGWLLLMHGDVNGDC